MNKLKIFVACHKPCEVKQDEVYTPIHVGRAISKCTDKMTWMQGDDTSDNISKKNPYYCEMTAQYWAWKNEQEADYIGFCHYRRYQCINVANENELKDLFQNCDVVLNDPYFILSKRIDILKDYVVAEDIFIMVESLKKLYPDYYHSLIEYSNSHYSYIANMLICSRDLFNDYAEWIFNILSECEKHIKLGPYNRQKRVFGYLAEFLMPLYFIHNNLRIKTVPFITEGSDIHKTSIKDKMKHILVSSVLRHQRKMDLYFDPSLIASLKGQGICF